ncbi:SEC14-like protein 3 isoform X1 [Tachypleus tridentatus]|uniref:SEC14-like protein 3 isoform X1 n=2 Tax=Tachypleus tridentatus TaxID=6853 RepID=UPI003FD5585C
MSGRVGDLTPDQAATLDAFRTAVDDILRPEHDDYFLLRYLRARHFDLVEAEAMLRLSIFWRKQMDVEFLREDYEPPDVIKRYFPGGLVGHDKEGCPLWIVPFGCMDIKGLFHSVKKSEFIKHFVHLLEKSEVDMKNQSEKLGKVIETHSVIFDMEKFTMKQLAWKPAVDMITQLVAICEDNYPERLKKIYVINASKIFPLAYALVKPVLSEETAKKIHVYVKDTWKSVLLEDIDPVELPSHWGGTKVDQDGDPRFSTIIGTGGFVPCSYYTAPSRRLSAAENLKKVVIEKKSLFPVELKIEKAGSVIRWEFQTECYDIGFGVFFRPNQEELTPWNQDEELISIQRVNCQLVPEDGMVVCEKLGTYILMFDNSFSWCRSKKLMYQVRILPPNSTSQESKPYT